MSKIPLPERGQPLDVSYIYELAKAVNDLSSQISPALYKYVTVDTPGVGQQSVKASEARILGGYKEIVNSASKTKGDTVPFSYEFNTDFKYAPIAVATPINVGNTPAGKNVSVVLKSVTTSKVEGVVIFNETGDMTVAVNLVVIGIPN
jgi:hypothetical protein